MGAVIKAAGTNVAPREVELAIEQHPGVMHAFVVGVPSDDGRGEAVAAAVVAKPDATLNAEDLRAELRAVLAAYKVPRHVAVFAGQGDLPWLESGKIDLQGPPPPARLPLQPLINEPARPDGISGWFWVV